MVDHKTFVEMNPDYPVTIDSDNVIETWSDDLFKYCHSSLFGFSFACKKWGELELQQFSEVEFKSNAFD